MRAVRVDADQPGWWRDKAANARRVRRPCSILRLLAAALGLETSDIGFGAHQPVIYSAGNNWRFAPLRDRAAVTRARPQGQALPAAFAEPGDGFPNAYVYCAEPLDPTHGFHVRLFAPAGGVPADPATGSAAASFAGEAVIVSEGRLRV
jgi:trans-2,3-dihydro-3-hydroxyanthranilate isomerase